MPDSLVDTEEFKTLLGVGDLYPDAEIEQITQAATNVILSYLVMYKARSNQASDTVAAVPPATATTTTLHTVGAHKFHVGQEVSLRGFGFAGWDKTVVVTEIPKVDVIIVESQVSWSPSADGDLTIIPNGTIYDTARINYYADVPEVVEAATAIAVDMWQSRLAPGGQINSVDFTPGPYRMGRSVITRVSGLLGQHMDVGSLVG